MSLRATTIRFIAWLLRFHEVFIFDWNSMDIFVCSLLFAQLIGFLTPPPQFQHFPPVQVMFNRRFTLCYVCTLEYPHKLADSSRVGTCQISHKSTSAFEHLIVFSHGKQPQNKPQVSKFPHSNLTFVLAS